MYYPVLLKEFFPVHGEQPVFVRVDSGEHMIFCSRFFAVSDCRYAGDLLAGTRKVAVSRVFLPGVIGRQLRPFTQRVNQ